MSDLPIRLVQRAVLAWHAHHGRDDLAWRNLKARGIDVPYAVMVAEFMLQQTQVDRVAPKYQRFLEKYPTIGVLAQAPTAHVIALWSGLGYNRRAILLQRTSQIIVEQYASQVPSDVTVLKALPGIGEYTAAAIAAFGFNEPVVVIDTNIERFYELLFFGHTKPPRRKLEAFAAQFIPVKRSRDWHEAIMDIMTTVRGLRSPRLQQEAVLQALKITPTWPLPVLGDTALARPKQTTYAGSKRYFRGRIIAYLTHQPKHCATLGEISFMLSEQHIPPLYSPELLLSELKKDGLVGYQDPLSPGTIINL